MRFKMLDNTVIDTANAICSWAEETKFDGSNYISVHTGSEWAYETLYCSRKGRYYVVHESNYQGRMPSAEWLSPQAAARWLLLNDDDLPDDLAALADEVSE